MAGPAGDFPVSYQYNREFIGGLRERRYYPTASATKKDQGLGYNLSRRCFQTIRTIPTARTAIPTSSTGFVTSRLITVRTMPRKVVAIVGDGGAIFVGINCVGTWVAAMTGAVGAVVTVLANNAKQQKWETSAVTVPVWAL